jgi:hypothetical protein
MAVWIGIASACMIVGMAVFILVQNSRAEAVEKQAVKLNEQLGHYSRKLNDLTTQVEDLLKVKAEIGKLQADINKLFAGKPRGKVDGTVAKAAEAAEAKAKAAEAAAKLSEAEVEKIRKEYLPTVFLIVSPPEPGIVFQPNGKLCSWGTAFAVDPAGKFATSAQVGLAVSQLIENGWQPLLISSYGKEIFLIKHASVHKKYEADEDAPFRTPNVGMLTIQLPPGKTLPVTVKLASAAELSHLKAGVPLCSIGFPEPVFIDQKTGESDIKLYKGVYEIQALISRGLLKGLKPLTEGNGKSAPPLVIEPDLKPPPGTWGNPIFDAQGHVVAIYAGEWDDQRWAMRIDLLKDLIAAK